MNIAARLDRLERVVIEPPKNLRCVIISPFEPNAHSPRWSVSADTGHLHCAALQTAMDQGREFDVETDLPQDVSDRDKIIRAIHSADRVVWMFCGNENRERRA